MNEETTVKKKKPTWLKVLIAVLVVALVALAIKGGTTVKKGVDYVEEKIAEVDYVDTTGADFGISDKVAEELAGYRNVAVLGVDARKGQDVSTTRSDAIIIMSINEETNEVVLSSVARDTYMLMDSSSGVEFLDKATHAHAFGGPVNTVKMLNQSLDLNIEEFVLIDWQGVADTVDGMGGITITVKDNEVTDLNRMGPDCARNLDTEWTEVTAGTQRFNGTQAVAYSRIRYTSGGDFARADRMKDILVALLDEVKKDPAKLTVVADNMMPKLTTNVTAKEVLKVIPTVPKMTVVDQMTYPFDYWGGIFNGSWIGVPTTVDSNVKELHKRMFKQEDYQLSEKAAQINYMVINKTGKQ